MPARLAGRCPPPPLMTHPDRSVSQVPCSTGGASSWCPRGGSYSGCVGGGCGTTLYLLSVLVISSAASTPSWWGLQSVAKKTPNR